MLKRRRIFNCKYFHVVVVQALTCCSCWLTVAISCLTGTLDDNRAITTNGLWILCKAETEKKSRQEKSFKKKKKTQTQGYRNRNTMQNKMWTKRIYSGRGNMNMIISKYQQNNTNNYKMIKIIQWKTIREHRGFSFAKKSNETKCYSNIVLYFFMSHIFQFLILKSNLYRLSLLRNNFWILSGNNHHRAPRYKQQNT